MHLYCGHLRALYGVAYRIAVMRECSCVYYNTVKFSAAVPHGVYDFAFGVALEKRYLRTVRFGDFFEICVYVIKRFKAVYLGAALPRVII